MNVLNATSIQEFIEYLGTKRPNLQPMSTLIMPILMQKGTLVMIDHEENGMMVQFPTVQAVHCPPLDDVSDAAAEQIRKGADILLTELRLNWANLPDEDRTRVEKDIEVVKSAKAIILAQCFQLISRDPRWIAATPDPAYANIVFQMSLAHAVATMVMEHDANVTTPPPLLVSYTDAEHNGLIQSFSRIDAMKDVHEAPAMMQ